MDENDQLIRTTAALRRAMARVSFERSCLDMGWEWEAVVSAARDTSGNPNTFGWMMGGAVAVRVHRGGEALGGGEAEERIGHIPSVDWRCRLAGSR